MHYVHLKKLTLDGYRNFDSIEIDTADSSILLIGQNGSGKTNILEALSLFFPGKGLRSAKWSDLISYNVNSRMQASVSAIFDSKIGIADLRNTFYRENNKRILEFNGSKIAAGELSKMSSIIWLTPQLDGIFLAGNQERRRFLDRMVYSFDLHHASNINKYEYYVAERNKILYTYDHTVSALNEIESKLADYMLLITKSRFDVIKLLQLAINDLDTSFPKVNISLLGELEGLYQEDCKNIKEVIKEHLLTNRVGDKVARRTTFGSHRSDFDVEYQGKNIHAKFCSTGEQKAMLVSIILAQVEAIKTLQQATPILLLDEIFVHLDELRREYLKSFLMHSGLQVWLTATDITGIEDYATNAKLIKF